MTTNRNILIITPFFAPETHAAVFRAHKLVKYLKKEGWNPIVLTVDINYVYNEDPNLLKELEGVPIYRARYIEPTLRGLKMAITGKDLTYKTLKEQGFFNRVSGPVNHQVQNVASKNQVSLFTKFYNYLLNHHLNSPDRYWTWKHHAIRKGRELIKKHDIKLIFTTMPVFTTGEIGLQLKKEFDLKWVADFRDPLTTVLRNHSDIESVFIKQRRICHKVFSAADIVSTASYAHNLIIHDIFKGKDFGKVKFIPTGLDTDYVRNLSNNKKGSGFYFVYSGEYLVENGIYFFKLFKSIVDEHEDLKHWRIKIVGNKTINMAILIDDITRLSLNHYVEFVDHVPQNELYQILNEAKAALLISEGRWWCSFAKMVDYIALKIPVIAQVPALSEAKLQLSKAGLGHFIEGEDFEKDRHVLHSFMNQTDVVDRANHVFCDRYLVQHQVVSFIKIFESLHL